MINGPKIRLFVQTAKQFCLKYVQRAEHTPLKSVQSVERGTKVHKSVNHNLVNFLGVALVLILEYGLNVVAHQLCDVCITSVVQMHNS